MARIRTIKPEFWVSEQIVECSTNARLLFIGLWNFCDDNGVHPAKCRTLKAQVFPMDDFSVADIQGWIAELLAAGLVIEFEHDGDVFWSVTGWTKHQKIDRPSAKYPIPPEPDSTKIRRIIDEHSSSTRETPPPGREVEGSGGRTRAKVVTPKAQEETETDPPGFAAFWAAWPSTERKASRKSCSQLWKRKKLSASSEEIIAHVDSLKGTKKWLDGFDPAPMTYLSQERWRDGLPSTAGAATGQFEGVL